MSAYASEKPFEFFYLFLKIVTRPLNFLDLSLYTVTQRVKTLFVNKNENNDVVFCICIEHDSKTRNKNLGFTSAR